MFSDDWKAGKSCGWNSSKQETMRTQLAYINGLVWGKFLTGTTDFPIFHMGLSCKTFPWTNQLTYTNHQLPIHDVHQRGLSVSMIKAFLCTKCPIKCSKHVDGCEIQITRQGNHEAIPMACLNIAGWEVGFCPSTNCWFGFLWTVWY